MISGIKHRFYPLVLIGALLGSMCLAPATTALADITFPEEFHGGVTVNNALAPVGAKIIAKIDGVECGNFTITEAGKYGGTGTFDKRLVVSGNEDDIGHTITFWIYDTQASQTEIYEPGESEELDLSVTQTYTYPLNADNVWITGALNYLRSAQDSDGSISGLSTSAWVVMAIAAAGEDPHNWKVGNNSIVDYLEGSADSLLNIATDWERSILAIVAAGENPRDFGGIDYVDTLLGFYDGNQMGTTDLNDDFWGILALAAIGESPDIIQNMKTFIKINQNADGGWGLTAGGNSDADNTAAAISALVAAGESANSTEIANALSYLKSQQDSNNGGFVSWGTTNTGVDCWAINAITDVGQNPTNGSWTTNGNNPVGHLLSMQIADGSFNRMATLISNPEWMTAYAVLALMGNSWPKDATPPAISGLTPVSGATVTTTSTTISASYSDTVSGINTATATIRVDGTNRTSSGTVTASSISYAASGLTVGTHSVTVTVSDKAGNKATRSWSFQVVTGGGSPSGGSPGGSGFDQVEASLFGETTEIDIDSDGVIQEAVEATSEDGKLTIIIEEGTVALDEVGEPLETLEVEADESPPAPPANTQVIGLAYDFGPDGATFDPPLTLTFEYEESEIPDDANEDDLVIAYWDEEAEEWVELDCTVDPVTNTITAEVSHFTVFAIIARPTLTATVVTSPPEPAAFSVSTLTVQPAEVQPNEVVTITASVANTGGTEGSYTVVLEINGLREAEQSVMVTAGRSEIITFSVTRKEAGTYNIVVEGLKASFTIVASPSQPPTAAPPAPPAKTPTNWPLIGGIIAGVIVVGLLVFLLVRRAYYY